MHLFQSRLIPRTFAAASNVTIAAALAGNAQETEGPKPA